MTEQDNIRCDEASWHFLLGTWLKSALRNCRAILTRTPLLDRSWGQRVGVGEEDRPFQKANRLNFLFFGTPFGSNICDLPHKTDN